MRYSDFEKLLDRENRKISDLPLASKNDEGEDVIIEFRVTKEGNYFQTTTIQKNGWLRVNVYWDDGTTEELYEK